MAPWTGLSTAPSWDAHLRVQPFLRLRQLVSQPCGSKRLQGAPPTLSTDGRANCSPAWVQVQLEVRKTVHKGWGVFTKQDIVEGTFVLEYVGEAGLAFFFLSRSQAGQFV